MKQKYVAVFQTESRQKDTLVAIFLCGFDADNFLSALPNQVLYKKVVDMDYSSWREVLKQGNNSESGESQ